jgi:hypothetical protein
MGTLLGGDLGQPGKTTQVEHSPALTAYDFAGEGLLEIAVDLNAGNAVPRQSRELVD